MIDRQHCPDAESLAAFVDLRSTDDGKRRISEHLATCDDCLTVVGEASRFNRMEDSASSNGMAEVRPFPKPALLAVAAILIVAIGTGILLLRREVQPDTYTDLIAAANEMTYRPYEGRLSEDFAWRPAPPVMRSGDASERYDIASLRLQTAAAAVLDDPDTEEQQKAQAELLAGDAQRAVDVFRSRAGARGATAAAWSDLAAAELTLALRGRSDEAAARAFEAAERAIALDPGYAPAWFNRASAAERLSRFSVAAESFARYLEIDDASPWAAEARERLDRLRRAGF